MSTKGTRDLYSTPRESRCKKTDLRINPRVCIKRERRTTPTVVFVGVAYRYQNGNAIVPLEEIHSTLRLEYDKDKPHMLEGRHMFNSIPSKLSSRRGVQPASVRLYAWTRGGVTTASCSGVKWRVWATTPDICGRGHAFVAPQNRVVETRLLVTVLGTVPQCGWGHAPAAPQDRVVETRLLVTVLGAVLQETA